MASELAEVLLEGGLSSGRKPIIAIVRIEKTLFTKLYIKVAKHTETITE